MDTLGQTLIQRNADEHERGAAMGLWVFSVGFGPIGHLTLGAVATSYGAPFAQAASGLGLMLVAMTLSRPSPEPSNVAPPGTGSLTTTQVMSLCASISSR